MLVYAHRVTFDATQGLRERVLRDRAAIEFHFSLPLAIGLWFSGLPLHVFDLISRFGWVQGDMWLSGGHSPRYIDLLF